MKPVFFSIDSRFFLMAFTAMFVLLMSCSENKHSSPMSEGPSIAPTKHTLIVPTGSSPSLRSLHRIKGNHEGEDSALSPSNTPVSRQVVFGYSFFGNMKEDETRNVNAFVSVVDAVNKVIDTLKAINATNGRERKNDTATILTKNVLVFKALDVHLLNAGDSDFIIKAFTDSRQLLDSVDGNSWTWAVTPKTNKKNSRLILNVIAEKPDGSRQPFNTITIPIDIQLDKDINRSLWQWMMDNPEKVLTIILIPLIIFFWKQITGLFKKKDADNKN